LSIPALIPSDTHSDSDSTTATSDLSETRAAQTIAPPVRCFPAEAIEEQVQIIPEHSLPWRAWHSTARAFEWLFGLASLLVVLAFVAAVPIVQFLSLGYLLEASGRIARTGRFTAGFVGVRTFAHIGSIVLGTWLMLLPLRLLSDLWYSAQLMDPSSTSAGVLRVALIGLTSLFIVHVLLAWYCGGRLRHFFWPLLAPFFLGMWVLRLMIASEFLRPLVRPVVGSISKPLLHDLTTVPALTTWFPPAIVLAAWRRGGMLAEARDSVWDFVAQLRLPYYFWMGARGFFGAVAWLLVPAVMMIGMTKLPALVSEAGGNLGAVQAVSAIGGLLGFFGALLMGLVLIYLPFMQVHFACENRFSAFREVMRVTQLFSRAPLAFWFALFITLLFALPLYLLKIEYTPQELLWAPSLVFVVFIYPARLLTGWAMARARHRQEPRSLLLSILFSGLSVVGGLTVVGFYVFVLFFTQYISWDGAWSLLEQHPFLLPAPFFGL
jgi:hypothetical protein